MKTADYMDRYSILRNIKRFSMEKTIHPQDLCGHGYSVGVLFYLKCRECMIEIDSETLFRVMNHDFVEAYTGDLNKRIKDKNAQTQLAWKTLEYQAIPNHLIPYTDEGFEEFLLSKGGEKLVKIFKLADAMDAFLYCNEEVEVGNTRLIGAMEYYRTKVQMIEEEIEFT